MLQGTMTALITPFRGERVDYDRFDAQIRFQIEQGIDGLVPVGTTGESPTLTHEEHRKVIQYVVKAVKKLQKEKKPLPAKKDKDGQEIVRANRVQVIAGTGSNSTAEALELTAHAALVEADGALLVNPYYNKPTQEGLYRHFMTIADAVEIPIILYNIPGRTSITMTPQTVARLARHPNIVAIKEATGSLDIATEIAALCDPEKFTILSGDDSLTLPLMSVGAKGVISVLSNIIPGRVRELTTAVLAGEYETARRLHIELFPLFKGMFVETNPIPIKTAMALAGMDTGELRLPLCEMAKANLDGLKKLLRESRIIK